jgi:hypothetical protein
MEVVWKEPVERGNRTSGQIPQTNFGKFCLCEDGLAGAAAMSDPSLTQAASTLPLCIVRANPLGKESWP